MKTKYKILTVLALIAVLIAIAVASVILLYTPPRSSAYAEDAGVWTPSADWEKSEVDGETIYSKINGNPTTMTYSEDYAAYDYVSMDVNLTDAGSGDQNNLGIMFSCENGVIVFADMNMNKYARIRRGEEFMTFDAMPTYEGEWFNFKIVFVGETMYVLVNGRNVLSWTNPNAGAGETFGRVKLLVSSWNCLPKVKNIAAVKKTSEPDYTYNSGWAYSEQEENGSVTPVYQHKGEYDLMTATAGLASNKSFSMDVNYKDVAVNGGDGNNNLGVSIPVKNKKDGDTSENSFFVFMARGNYVAARYSKTGESIIDSATYAFPAQTDKWFNFKIVAIGESMHVFVDGENVMSFANPDTENVTLAETKFNISSWGLPVYVKNLTVTAKTGDDFYFDPAGYSYSIENGEDVFTHFRADPDTVSTATANGTYNTFSANVRLNDSPTNLGDGNISLSIKLNATDSYLFEYNPAPSRSYVRLRYFDAEHRDEGIELGKVEITVAPVGEWINLKAVFERDYLVYYIDGKKVISHFDTGAVDFSVAAGAVSMWIVTGSVKNITCENTDKDYAGVSYVELEFKKEVSTMVFDADNGDISWEESGALDLTVTGANPSITSPRIEVAEGSMYSMKLPVRNTFAVRLKNNTAADKLTLNYITAVDETYDEVKQKTFDIEPNSDYKTYYLNISDVADCGHWETDAKLKACKHFLRGFKFTFDGATSGDIFIDAITFERENRIWERAATELAATADKDKNTVTVSGTLLGKYAGQTVTVYETSVKNYNELLSYKDNVKVAEGKATKSGEFSITFPLVRENGVSHMSTVFLAAVNGVKLDDSFMIGNWRDFTENPYAFKLNDLTVDVTTAQFGAKGDGFTNDNAAIQAAIDHVSAQGGGTVLLPGDTSNPYGRRYIATQLNLKNNVELNIAEGAVLWQSQRFDDYAYDGYAPVYGHDIYIEGTPWTHAAASWNLPFIYANGVKNVRVTGGGEIRMMDTGTQWLDGNSYGDTDIVKNCAAVIHLHVFASYNSENIEVSDITTTRGNIWHMPNENSKNLYFGNVRMTEVSCINGDGLSFGYGTSNVYIDRCTLYSNDDAIVLSAFYDDPRGHTEHSWWQAHPDPERFSGVRNFSINRSNMYGGHGLTFITWGSNGLNEENVEIRDFYVVDNVLGGTSTSVGCWTDNPFYGESWIEGSGVQGTYTQWEKDDFSPIKNLYIMNNIYTDPCLLGTWAGDTPELAVATNAITDCGIYSPSDFVNGSFDKRLKNVNEKTWETRLAYWSHDVEENGEVGVEKVGTKLAPVKGSDDKIEIDDRAGYIKGAGELFQGLHNIFGSYEFSAKIKLVSGSAKMFVRDAISGKILAEKELTAGDEFEIVKLAYSLDKSTTVQLGIAHGGEADEIIYIDDATVAAIKDPTIFDVEGPTHLYNFDSNNGLVAYNPNGAPVSVNNGILTVPGDAEYKIVLDQVGKLKEFDLGVDIMLDSGLRINAGVYFSVGAVGYAADKIDAYNVQVEYNPSVGAYYYVHLYEFSAETGFVGRIAQSAAIPLPVERSTSMINLRVVVKGDIMFAFTGGNDDYALMYEMPKGYDGGNVGLRSQNVLSRFDNFYVKTTDFVDVPGNRAELDKALAVANKFAESAYTKESYAALAAAISAANGLSSTATQSEIDSVKRAVDTAINGLVEATVTPPEPEIKVEYVTKTVTEKENGMTIGFYVVLGLLIAVVATGAVMLVMNKKKAKNR